LRVTRIVNFAHGAFYMLGAYVAFTAEPNDFRRHRIRGAYCARSLIVA